jgi:hypothetical protein
VGFQQNVLLHAVGEGSTKRASIGIGMRWSYAFRRHLQRQRLTGYLLMAYRLHLLGEIVASRKFTCVIRILTDAIFVEVAVTRGVSAAGWADVLVLNCALQRCWQFRFVSRKPFASSKTKGQRVYCEVRTEYSSRLF